MKELKREPVSFESSNVYRMACPRCGSVVELKYNGGELDYDYCCGLTFYLEATGYEAVVFDVDDEAVTELGDEPMTDRRNVGVPPGQGDSPGYGEGRFGEGDA